MTMELHYGTPQEAEMLPSRVEHVKALARGWVDEGVHPALVVLAARKGVIFLHEAFGKLRPGPDSPPLGKDSIFPIMSATKPITAACVLLLVEEGKVGLMRPVRDYFPEITGAGTEEVLVHHLLTHLSGWRDIDLPLGEEGARLARASPAPRRPDQHQSVADFLQSASALSTAARPGEAFNYCQLNYELLADLVRRASGLPLERFARERIFEPLGMADSGYVLPAEHRRRKVNRGDNVPGDEVLGVLWPGVDTEEFEGIPSGSTGVHTTARDYAAFAQMLMNGGTYGDRRVLSRSSVEAMRRNHLGPGVPVRWDAVGPGGRLITIERTHSLGGYGYGLFLFLDGVGPYGNGGLASRASFSHAGLYGTYWWADPDRQVVGVYLSVPSRYRAGTAFPDLRADLFVDAVTAAVDD